MTLYWVNCDSSSINDENYWDLILEAICSLLPEQFKNFVRRKIFIMIENETTEPFLADAVSFRGIRSIIINGDLLKNRPFIFVRSLFHEIAHICLGHLDNPRPKVQRMEWQASNLASEWISSIGWGNLKPRFCI